MYKEIGSEFWEAEVENVSKDVEENYYEFLLTGRTALDYLIKDIKASKNVNIVYMPSYCCHTMIQPFIDNGMSVEFYDIGFEEGKYTYEIDFETPCDLVLIMQYFGYYNEMVEEIIMRFKESGKIVIEDATHSWLSKNQYSWKADYVFASLRKWTGIACGAVVIKRYGEFIIPLPSETNYSYIEVREKAAVLKKKYIIEGLGQKSCFLQMFNRAEDLLEQDYRNYNILNKYKDILTRLDTKKIRQARQNNARILIEGLGNLRGIECIKATGKDAPLFVPIIVHNKKRNELRQFLIKNSVYCPVHWPLSDLHKIKNKELYEDSLSLICDQRYKPSEVIRIVELISNFYGKEA